MCEKTEKQHELDKRYLRMAAIWAENSYCKRRQVGALLVKDKMIISDGYNGTPAGFENVCEDENKSPSLMFYMRRLTPSQKWQPHRTAVKERPFMLPPPLALNARN